MVVGDDEFTKNLRESLFKNTGMPRGFKKGVKFFTQGEMEERAARNLTAEEFAIWKAQCRHEI